MTEQPGFYRAPEDSIKAQVLRLALDIEIPPSFKQNINRRIEDFTGEKILSEYFSFKMTQMYRGRPTRGTTRLEKNHFWKVRKLAGAAFVGLLGTAECPVEVCDYECIVESVSLVT